MVIRKVNSDTLDKAVFLHHEPCVVIFSRKGCHVCSLVIPRLEELAKQYGNEFTFLYIDAEEERALLKRFSLKGVPQVLFFKDGDFYGKLAGDIEEDLIKEKLDELL